ncbi:ABC transporter substrate-binding protein [Paracoccus siganidrum]|uniref:ABC transporter substrate-binding protein n=1 Tax=Paracoccus siganidrum TaxID=1276757 RepID=A0A419A7J3_9RHOB|nr:ABC transporter substrate-binding protein [Paracoccus siganidrum]RJL16405.1 ABC transporter substrate-binding protein [Paracoccus siganidrum]RMC34605.1 ABC transporter substrate-binding protein [Paracoccus siganidrum]
MKKLLSLATALTLLAGAGAAQQITVMSWGGTYSQSQIEAYHKPFTAQTGISVINVDSDNPAIPIKAQVEAGNVTTDVVDIEYADAIRLCDEGMLEEIDPAILPPAPDGTPATEDFLPQGLNDCAVGSIVFSTIFAYDSTRFPDEAPQSMADFFDIETFPGKRGLKKAPKALLEMALMADGVPADEVYALLSTDEGIDRAFAKLDSIKRHVVWWETGAQPPQLLADGEVAMTTAYNGRIFTAAVSEGKPFEMVWDGQVYEYNLFAIPRGAPNQEAALEFIKFATDTQRLADQAKWISYGPARRSSAGLVGLYQDGRTEMGPHMPTSPENMRNALASSYDFWVDREAELTERFSAWLAAR